MRIEEVQALLGRERIDGTAQELEVLCIRMGDLVRLNGEAWVVANRDRLLREWKTILQKQMIR
jgi:hypothetical protein